MKRKGTIDTGTLSMTGDEEADAIRYDAAIRKRMAPAGALGLPPLLEKRRLEYGLVDEMFELPAVFDRIFIYQIEAEWAQGETFQKDGLIIRPERTKERNKSEAPVGILVGAGLAALDALRANGVDLGHIVSFVRLSPWRMPIAMVEAKEVNVMILRAGDILGSFDLADRLRNGCSYQFDHNTQQHTFVDEAGLRWLPRDPTKDFEE